MAHEDLGRDNQELFERVKVQRKLEVMSSSHSKGEDFRQQKAYKSQQRVNKKFRDKVAIASLGALTALMAGLYPLAKELYNHSTYKQSKDLTKYVESLPAETRAVIAQEQITIDLLAKGLKLDSEFEVKAKKLFVKKIEAEVNSMKESGDKDLFDKQSMARVYAAIGETVGTINDEIVPADKYDPSNVFDEESVAKKIGVTTNLSK